MHYILLILPKKQSWSDLIQVQTKGDGCLCACLFLLFFQKTANEHSLNLQQVHL